MILALAASQRLQHCCLYNPLKLAVLDSLFKRSEMPSPRSTMPIFMTFIQFDWGAEFSAHYLRTLPHITADYLGRSSPLRSISRNPRPWRGVMHPPMSFYGMAAEPLGRSRWAGCAVIGHPSRNFWQKHFDRVRSGHRAMTL